MNHAREHSPGDPSSFPRPAERAVRLHAEAVVVDTHSDTPLRMRDPAWDFMERHGDGHMDWPRIREGGLDAVFLAVYMGRRAPGTAAKEALAIMDRVLGTVERNPDRLALARTVKEIRGNGEAGKTSIVLAVEGGHIMDNDLGVLRCFHRLGARAMTLTHAFHHDWADAAYPKGPAPPGKGGLTAFGREVVREMNRLGMMVDISHVSDDTFWQTLEVSQAPLIATHSGARALCPSPRNLTDDMLRALGAGGGQVQAVFFPGFLDPAYEEKKKRAEERRAAREQELHRRLAGKPEALAEAILRVPEEIPVEGTPLSVLVDHIEHMARLAGPEHVGLGADWDGIPEIVEGMEDCSRLPRLTEALLARGFTDREVRGILGENVLRYMERVEETAKRLAGSRAP